MSITGLRSFDVVGKERLFLDGQANAYQTFTLSQIRNVDRVLFEPGEEHAINSVDNIVVPEPGTLSLLLIGTLLVRRRSKPGRFAGYLLR